MIARAASAGSAAPVIGRPMTRMSAPARALLRRHHPALVGEVGALGPDARHHQQKVRTARLAQRFDLPGRTDHTVQPAALRERCEPHDLVGGGPFLADGGKIVLVDAGEHRHRDQPDRRIDRGRRLARRAQHRLAAGGVDVEDRHAQPCDLARGAGDGVGDVVELDVCENRQPRLDDGRQPVWPARGQEFEPDLESAHIGPDRLGQVQSTLEIGGIDRDEDRVLESRHRRAS